MTALYTIPPAERPARPPRDPAAPRDYWEALLEDSGQCPLLHEPPDPAEAPLGYGPPLLETRAGQVVAVAYALGTPAERDAERLRQWRESAILGPLELRAALAQTGRLAAVEALMADPATPTLLCLAWEHSTLFPRCAGAIEALGAALGATAEELDALYRIGQTIGASFGADLVPAPPATDPDHDQDPVSEPDPDPWPDPDFPPPETP